MGQEFYEGFLFIYLIMGSHGHGQDPFVNQIFPINYRKAFYNRKLLISTAGISKIVQITISKKISFNSDFNSDNNSLLFCQTTGDTSIQT